MNIDERIKKIAEYSGCAEKIREYDELIDELNKSRLKNIAVIGETNCGKTTLINKLAGETVRKISEISMNEPPMMVTFGSDEVKQGFEKHEASNKRLSDANIALYEIPVNDAVEYGTGKITNMLEQMDVVIYIISSITPLTGSDIKNLDALSAGFPVMIFISKSDLIEDEDRKEVNNYIIKKLSDKYEGVIFGFYDSTQKGFEDEIIESLSRIETAELREFHRLRIEQLVKAAILEKLRIMEDEMQKKREARVRKQSENERLNRDRELEWSSIRLTMLEKRNETISLAAKVISKAEAAAEKEAIAAMAASGGDRVWIKNEFKPLLENSVNSCSVSVMNEVRDVVDAHTAWLVSEVNHKFNIDLEIQDMDVKEKYISGEVKEYTDKRSYKKVMLAVGSGVVASGSILSSMPLLPTIAVAVPATLLMLSFAKGSIDEANDYNKKINAYVVGCCSKTFARLKKRTESSISNYYEKLTEEIVEICESGEISTDFSDINRTEAEIKKMIAELNII